MLFSSGYEDIIVLLSSFFFLKDIIKLFVFAEMTKLIQ